MIHNYFLYGIGLHDSFYVTNFNLANNALWHKNVENGISHLHYSLTLSLSYSQFMIKLTEVILQQIKVLGICYKAKVDAKLISVIHQCYI